ncbi:MAG: MEKHLA domain-containing protein [Cyanobacteriota bacterium]|nr:MEKHLA domain-containing protein [Cyanobacteriota bacterium]
MNDLQSPWQQEFVQHHTQRLLSSFQHWIGRKLLDRDRRSPEEIAQALFEAPFVVVSHGTESDPIFNYGNRKALELWELSWDEFTQMPSRQTAEPPAREERQRLIAEAAARGFVENISGIRISSTGRRFSITNVTLWNVLDAKNRYCGQAAIYSQWQFL